MEQTTSEASLAENLANDNTRVGAPVPLKSNNDPANALRRTKTTGLGSLRTESYSPGGIESEQIVLGLALKDGPKVFQSLSESLREDDFSNEDHRRIFSFMEILQAAGNPVTLHAVAEHLNGSLKQPSYLQDLASHELLSWGRGNLKTVVAGIKKRLLLKQFSDACLRHYQSAARAVWNINKTSDPIANALKELQAFETTSDDADSAPKVFTLAELRKASFPEPEPIVEDFLHAGETILLVGRPKVGKSRLVQQLTINLSRGQNFLGLAVRKPRRVLLLDLENRPAGARKRFLKMSQADDGDEQVVVYAPETLAANTVNVSSPSGIANFRRYVETHDPDVVIVDTWRLLVGGDENKTEIVVKALKNLSMIRQERPHLAIILVHHLRKQQGENPPKLRIDPASWVEACSGHHSLLAHCDGCYGMEREIEKNSGEEIIVFGGVARNTTSRPVLLTEDNETLLFDVADGEDALQKLLTKKEREFWECAQNLAAFSFKELVETAGTTNKKAVASMLNKAQSMGRLRRTMDGSYEVVDP